MTLDDPARKRLGGFPMYYWGAQPVGPLSGFTVSPISSERIRITFNLMRNPGISSQYHYIIPIQDVAQFYAQWFFDPELIFQSLGWVYDAPAVKSLSLSLKDLGL